MLLRTEKKISTQISICYYIIYYVRVLCLVGVKFNKTKFFVKYCSIDFFLFIYFLAGFLKRYISMENEIYHSIFCCCCLNWFFLRYQQLTHIGCVCCVYFIYLKYISFAYFYIIMKLKSHIYVIHVAVSQLSYEFVYFFLYLLQL